MGSIDAPLYFEETNRIIHSVFHLRMVNLPPVPEESQQEDEITLNDGTLPQIRNESESTVDVAATIDCNRVSFLYYYGQFPDFGLIFIGFEDGSISMVSLPKYKESSDDSTFSAASSNPRQTKKFSVLDRDRKRNKFHDSKITGILCFHTKNEFESLLVTSCEGGYVKFWTLYYKHENDETPSLQIINGLNDEKLSSSVKCLKFVYNEDFYKNRHIDSDYLLGVFHLIAVCEDGNVYSWDPSIANRFIAIATIDMYQCNLFSQLVDEKKRDLKVICATVSQKNTTTQKAFIICGLSNGKLLQCEVVFNGIDKAYLNSCYSISSPTIIEIDRDSYSSPNSLINTVVEMSPMVGDGLFLIQTSNSVYYFNANSQGFFIFYSYEDGEERTVGEYGMVFSQKRVYRFGNPYHIPLQNKNGEPCSAYKGCWVLREYLYCLSNEKGDLLLFENFTNEWIELCIHNYTLSVGKPFMLNNEEGLSDIDFKFI